MRSILRRVRLAIPLACFTWIAMLAVSASFAQSPAPLIQNVINRTTVSLDGVWHYIVDPHEEARRGVTI
jgi:hypothetical protein